eukprot:6337967-Amphidinium_carterae.1
MTRSTWGVLAVASISLETLKAQVLSRQQRAPTPPSPAHFCCGSLKFCFATCTRLQVMKSRTA